MKILLCSSTYDGITHGPAKFANLIMQINELNPEHEVRVITRDVSEEQAGRIYKFERVYPRFIGAFWEYWDNSHFLDQIKRVNKEYKTDVIVFVDAVLGYKSAKHFKGITKTVGLINDDEYLNNSIGVISLSKEWLIKWKSRQLEKRAAHQLDLVIGNSDFITEKIMKRYNLADKKVKRLYKSIDISKFDYVEHGPIDKHGQIKILFIKNDYKRGGLRELAEAVAVLKNYNFKVYVAGPHDHQKGMIDKYFEGKENVEYCFKGKIGQQEVKTLMDSCDILSVPALREGLGVANIEALAKGIPIVSTTAGGIPEVTNGEKCAWLAKAGDVSSLSNAINDCVENHDEKTKRSKAGRKRVEEMFGHKKMLADFLSIISAR